MKLKNYTSTASLSNIFKDIEETLTEHGAKQIIKDYDGGKVTAISFVVVTSTGKPLAIRLPARFDRVEKIFENQGVRYKDEQPYRTSWATIRDWISAQMAILDWEMVRLEEVFLPYVVNNQGKTLFEAMEKTDFYLPSGEDLGE